MQDKVLSMIGLAARARKLASGEFAVLESIKKGTAKLVIVANDASPNTIKKFADKCSYYGVELLKVSDKENLGHILGKEERAAAAITDEGFAAAILKKTDSLNNK